MGRRLPPTQRAARLMRTETPACWTWRPPTAVTMERLQEKHLRWGGRAASYSEQDWRWILMVEWQSGRCAVCSLSPRLVEDHDHKTGLTRGLLCTSCNILEGSHPGDYGIFGKYRKRCPAMICGYHQFYVDPVTGYSAEPETAPSAEWWAAQDQLARLALERAMRG